MKELALGLAIMLGSVSGFDVSASPALAQDMSNGAANFYKSDRVDVKSVTFRNQYNMQVAGHLFTPKDMQPNAKLAAIVVGHPMGAVKEQSADLYATKMAEQGFVTLSIDLSFWGDSEGKPRNAVLPEVYTEDFNAAVDYLGSQTFVDRERIGALGICGSGGFAINAAKVDPRMKAIATVSMYDMGAVTRNGLGHSQTVEQRKAMIAAAANQRYAEFQGGETKWLNYLPKTLPANADPITREFHDFYRSSRGEAVPEGTPAELSQNRAMVQEAKFVNFYPFNDIETISPRPMLFITGDKSHSREFSEDAYKRAGEPRELYIVPNAGHVDLYDRVNLIPFEKLTDFFRGNLNS
ncbi:alpha/beta hydrolase [Microvirga aerophila]|uniref:Membrane protein n=1 Tax=Microvirga aerophila TaxID=670291 RepID=A0A512BYD4_9HYPH|nr:alpha/beta hydrolase [Microvirga aerophila]GEO16950.1 membrane protein [Microvirga aerophila]